MVSVDKLPYSARCTLELLCWHFLCQVNVRSKMTVEQNEIVNHDLLFTIARFGLDLVGGGA